MRLCVAPLLMLALLLVAWPALAEPVPVRVGTHATYERVVFDWPQPVAYELVQQGNRIEITFQQRDELQVSRLVRGGLRHVTYVGQEIRGNQRLLRLAVPAGVRVSHFRNGHAVVLDIHAPDPGKPLVKEPAPVAATAVPAAAASAAPPTVTPVGPPSSEAPAEVPTQVSGQAPALAQVPPNPSSAPVTEAAGPDPAPPAAPAAAPLPDPAAPVVADQPGTAEPAPPPAAAPVTGVADQKLPLPPAQVRAMARKLASMASPAADTITAAPALAAAGRVRFPALRQEPQPILALEPQTESGIALWVRAGYAYLVFDRLLGIDLSGLTGGIPLAIDLEPVQSAQVTMLRFPVPQQVSLQAVREGTRWIISASLPLETLPLSMALEPQPDYALGARLLFPAGNNLRAISFTDPVVGDSFWIVPLPGVGQAIAQRRLFADMEFLPAVQGAVVKILSDNVLAEAVTDGIEFSRSGGLKLSPRADTGVASDIIRQQAELSQLFDFTRWRGLTGEDFTRGRQRLQMAIADVPDVERDRAVLDLARFYFARGMGQEALGLLTLLVKRVPDLANRPEFLALRGAAQILAGHPQRGQDDLQHPQLRDLPEVALWRGYAAALERDWPAAARDLSAGAAVLAGYPEPLYTDMAVLRVEAALAADDLRDATAALEQLLARREAMVEAELIDGPAQTQAMAFLRGVLALRANDPRRAERYWQQATRGHDRLYRTRAELALVDLARAENKITPATASARLERLRYAWRGDDLELEILRRLGAYHLEAEEAIDGLRTLGRASRLFPESALSQAIRQDMEQAFRDVLVLGKNKSLTPLEALALYEEFRDLTPAGKDGIILVQGLVDKLVAVDLLDRAALLLEQELLPRVGAAERAALSARLAGIRLLNTEPEKALQALAASDADAASATPAVQRERRLLQARALGMVGKTEEGLALLATQTDTDSRLLLVDLYWRAKRHQEAAAILDGMTSAWPVDKPLQPEQAQLLLRQALALALANDREGLGDLRTRYTAAMLQTDLGDAFRLATKAEVAGGTLDLAAVERRVAEVDLFQSFLQKFRRP